MQSFLTITTKKYPTIDSRHCIENAAMNERHP